MVKYTGWCIEPSASTLMGNPQTIARNQWRCKATLNWASRWCLLEGPRARHHGRPGAMNVSSTGRLQSCCCCFLFQFRNQLSGPQVGFLGVVRVCCHHSILGLQGWCSTGCCLLCSLWSTEGPRWMVACHSFIYFCVQTIVLKMTGHVNLTNS